ncbi:unnamed protein product [marine sediment metagenome]|uniref:Right handed beta helix domain-containing protein n=1 Tax=marine sediment metagenome TaxID=412755 RepID=X1DR12_9ZZZZ
MSDSNLPLWDVLRNWWDILQEVDTRTSTIVVSASNSVDPNLAPAAYRCSGAADDVEINAALTAASAVGGEVLLLEGLYVPGATITYPANILGLRGLGRATFIQPVMFGNAINVTGRDDIVIRDLAIDSKTGGTFGHCIHIEDGSDRFRIENVWIIDSDLDGIHVEDTTIDTGHIEGCHILDADGTGIEVDMDAANFMYRLHVDGNDIRNCGAQGILFAASGGNHYCKVTNNIVLSCTSDGIFVSDGDHSMIQGNTCTSNGGEGIYLISTEHAQVLGNTCQGNALDGIYLSTSDNTTVVGNTCQGNTLSGISLDSSNGCNLTGNTCQGNVRHGIYMESSNNNMVVGNACNGNDALDAGFDGISILVASGNLILGNQSRDNGGWGIMVGNASDYNKVSNNYTSGNTLGSIRVNNINCDGNQIEFNTVEEGAPSDAPGTNTRSYGNYDPSANAFVGNVGAAPW